MDSMSVVNKKSVLVPPDGGWGYLICVAVTIIYTSTSMFANCFGQVFDEFMRSVDMTSSALTLMNSLSIMSAAIASFVTSPLLKFVSKRQAALFGAILYNIGVCVTIVIKTQISFIIFQGIIQCFGVGMLYNIGFTIVNEYFVEKRFLAISIVQSVTGTLIMVTPYFVSWSLDYYGYRGTLVLIAGVTLQSLVAVALMHPVQWHLKEVVVDDTPEIKLLMEGVKMAEKSNQLESVKVNEKDEINEKKVEDGDEKTVGLWCRIKSYFNLVELRSFLFSNALLGTTLTMFSDLTFTLMLPQALKDLGWDDASISNALFLSGLGDLVVRISFIFLNKWLSRIGCQEVYIAGMFVGFVARLGMLWAESPIAIMVFITLIGSCRCVIMILPPLIIAEVVPPELFSSAMGMSMLATGVVSLVLGPAIGTIRDLTQSYPTAFYILASFFLIVVIFWTIELCYKRNKHKRNRPDLDNIK